MPRQLDASKRQFDAAARAVVVNEHLPAAQSVRQAQGAAAVTRPHARHQAVGRAVGQGQGFGLVIESHYHLHRTEDFLLRQAVLRRHARQQRGRHPATAARQVRRQRRLCGDAQAAIAGQCQIALDNLALAARNQRPYIGIEQRRPHAQRAVALGHPCHDLFEDRGLNKDARSRRTGLPGVLNARVDQRRQGRFEVGIGEHDLRTLATQFQRYWHGVLRR